MKIVFLLSAALLSGCSTLNEYMASVQEPVYNPDTSVRIWAYGNSGETDIIEPKGWHWRM